MQICDKRPSDRDLMDFLRALKAACLDALPHHPLVLEQLLTHHVCYVKKCNLIFQWLPMIFDGSFFFDSSLYR
ncbi:hypothetical protein B6A27_14035 [Anoxybacillus sp. UARK-01]|nr:hypothetical protein B6A27_14035 [Anoxybacillus sp. UARK-01]